MMRGGRLTTDEKLLLVIAGLVLLVDRAVWKRAFPAPAPQQQPIGGR